MVGFFCCHCLYLVKRFFPSEFGNDADRTHAVEPAKTMFVNISHIRQAVEADGISCTHVSSNLFDGIYLASLLQLRAAAPPREKVVIPDDGKRKG